MKRIKRLLMIAVLAFGAIVGFKAGSYELAYMEFQEDLRDLSQPSAYSKYPTVRSEQDYRDAVMRRAQDHDIQLDPSAVTVQRAGSGPNSGMYLAADYSETVDVLGYSFTMHFTPSSKNKQQY